MEQYGYVKANKLTSEYILRQDMIERGQATTISLDEYRSKKFDITKENQTEKINIEAVYSITESNIEISEEFEKQEDYKTWVSISNKSLEKQTNTILEDYKTRTNLINNIVDNAIENNINGVVIDFNGIENKDSMLRFVIELAPKLREIGITASIVLNENIEKDDYINIIDYIIE